jgi:hypothetical protein
MNKKNKLIGGIFLFIIWFFIYLGNLLYLKPITFASDEFVYGSDAVDIVEDMRNVNFDSKDNKKHLLFSPITAPLVDLVQLIFNFPGETSILVVLAVISALNITLIYIILISEFSIVPYALWFASIFGLMHINFVIFSIPETYSLSGLVVLLYFLCLFKLKDTDPVIYFGVLSILCGLAALINPVLLSLTVINLFLIVNKNNLEMRKKYFLIILSLLIPLVIFIIPNWIIYRSGFFPFSVNYINKYGSFLNLIDMAKIIHVTSSFLIYSVIPPFSIYSIYINSIGLILAYLIIFLLYLGLLVAGIFAYHENKEVLNAMGLWVLCLIIFFIYFNPEEAMLYSTIITFPIFLFISLGFSKVNFRYKYLLLGLFTVLLIFYNYKIFSTLINWTTL